MQVVANVVHAVESFRSECASSVMTNDESLCDYLSLRLDSVIRNLEELMQYVGSHSQCESRHTSTLTDFNILAMYVCTQPVVGINPPGVERQPDLPGRPFLHINIDQVERLRQVGYAWQEVADAVGVSHPTLWRYLWYWPIRIYSVHFKLRTRINNVF